MLMIENSEMYQKIIAAAREEFGTYGFKDASTNRIYPRAGVSKGMIFKIFGSKSLLFYEVFKIAIQKMLDEMKAAELDKEPDIIKKISYIASWKIAYAGRNPWDMKIMLDGIAAPPKQIKDLLEKHFQDLLKLNIESYFEEVDMTEFRDEYSKADLIRNIKIASQGIQNVYLNQLLTIEDFERVKDEIMEFFNTLVRGMKKNG